MNIDELSEEKNIDVEERAIKMYKNYVSKATFNEWIFKLVTGVIVVLNLIIFQLLKQNPENTEMIIIIGWVILFIDILHFFLTFFGVFKNWSISRITAFNIYLKYKAYRRKEEPFNQKTKNERETALDKALDEIKISEFNFNTELMNDMKETSDKYNQKSSKKE